MAYPIESMENNSVDVNILSYFNDIARCVCGYLAFQLI